MTIGGKRLVLQPRDRSVLSALALLRVLDRKQVARLAGFTSVTRTNVRLSRLRQAGLITRYFTSSETGSRRAVYTLNRLGAAEIHAPFAPTRWRPDSIILGNAFIAHQLRVADVYIAVAQAGVTWEQPSGTLDSSVSLIPDAFIQTATHAFFVEVDLGTESPKIWSKKIAEYLKFASSGAYKKAIRHPSFSVLVIAETESRLSALRRQTERQTQKLFWFATLETIMGRGFWSASWLRATGDQRSLPGA